VGTHIAGQERKHRRTYQKEYVRDSDNLISRQAARLILVEMPRVLQVKGNSVIVFVIYNIHLLFFFAEIEKRVKQQVLYRNL
jgi:hypothetical protein